MQGTDFIVQYLMKHESVSHVFTYAGGTNAWLLDALHRTDGISYIPPESVIAELAEAVKNYADTHSKEAVRQIVRITFDLEGYKECGLELWKLLYKINNIRVQMLTLDPKDKQRSAAALEEIVDQIGHDPEALSVFGGADKNLDCF
ncbi:hypothetical protein LCGC14_1867190 [marine sediment metagenome]|uniref:Uncharacterized protein n=1 Tax=marine sediment metagenome TaxID=412755 RepID=A0A0F9IK41_9ZZZZ